MAQIQCTCPRCGTAFARWPSQMQGAVLYCSRICSGLGRRTNPARSAPCDHCGKPYVAWPSQRRRFCSYACSKPGRRVLRPDRACQQCGAPLSRDAVRPGPHRFGMYCSRVCAGLARRRPLLVRFWASIDKTETCWLWTGNRDADGYGQLPLDGSPRRLVRAHRLSWQIHRGPTPRGVLVLHHCDTPPCVNPEHLFLGNTSRNRQDCVSKGRQARGETSGLAKLTAEQVLEIREAGLHAPVPYTMMALHYGVSRQHIWAIAGGKGWKHIE